MKIKLFPNKVKACDYVADIIVKLINEKPDAVLGVSANPLASELYQSLGKNSKVAKLDYSEVKIFNLENQLDGVVTNQPATYTFMKNNLFKKLPNLKKPHVFFPTLGANYEQQINQQGGIDLQILVLQEDGSVGYNFENSTENSLTRKVYDMKISSGSGLTMGLATILQAKKILLIAFGQQQLQAFKKLQKLHQFDQSFPISILKNHPNFQVIVDEEAF